MRLSRVKISGGNKLAFYDEAGFMLLEDAAKKAGKDFEIEAISTDIGFFSSMYSSKLP
jgi:hypothetical protein